MTSLQPIRLTVSTRGDHMVTNTGRYRVRVNDARGNCAALAEGGDLIEATHRADQIAQASTAIGAIQSAIAMIDGELAWGKTDRERLFAAREHLQDAAELLSE